MKIISIAAGAAGMICGNCLHDNTLAAAMMALGHDVLLVPTYTPLRTDEADVSAKNIFYGGLNVYLQQKMSWLGRTPEWIDRWLDSPALLRWVSRLAVSTEAKQLGELTVSVMRGEHGAQQKELRRLVEFLKKEQPDAVTITNSMLSAIAPAIRRELGVPVLCWLQGEDHFLENLPSPYGEQAHSALLESAPSVSRFLATCRDQAQLMAPLLGLPWPEIGVILPGLNLDGYRERHPRASERFVIGYLARIAPDKGLHLLAEAVEQLRVSLPAGAPKLSLRVAGWLGENEKPYLEEVRQHARATGWEADFEYLGSVSRAEKIEFLRSLDALAVPVGYRASKGLYVLEALACGVPVVQPRSGIFPELIEATGGGLVFEPHDAGDLARGLRRLLENPKEADAMGRQGRTAVYERFNAERMARETLAAIENLL